MAPFDPSKLHSNIGAYITLSLAFSAIASLFFLVSRTLVRAYRSLPIAQRTRAHDAQRRSGTLVFAALAVLSLAVNMYTFQEMIVDSYRNWAFDNKQVFPVDVWTTPVWYPRPGSKDLQLGRWMQENDMKDCVKVIGGSWRDYWWQQQHAMGTAVWTIFMTVEGRRRNIPHTWALLPIAHFIGLSVAQNLFYLTLLFTPVPLPARASSGRLAGPLHELRVKIFGDTHSRPHTWVPKPIVYLVPLVLSVLCTSLLPYGIGTPFQDFFLSAPQALCYLTLLATMTTILPSSFGTSHRTIHAAHAATTPVFRTAAVLSFMLYVTSTTMAILSNTPPAQRTLFGILFRDNDPIAHSTLERYRLAVARMIGALSDHPIIQKVGWDVLLSCASLCIWTGFRGLDPRTMLSVLGFPVAAATKAKKAVVRSARSASSASSASASSSRTTKSLKDKGAALVSEAVSSATTAAEAAITPGSPTKHKRKPSGGGATAAAKKAFVDDKEDTPPITRSHKPIASSPPSSPKAAKAKSKSKNAKAKDVEPPSPPPSPPAVIAFDADAEDHSAGAAGAAYSPPGRSGSAGMRAIEHEEGREAGGGAEGAALAWGLCVLGGLGVGMAGMAGGEAV